LEVAEATDESGFGMGNIRDEQDSSAFVRASGHRSAYHNVYWTASTGEANECHPLICPRRI